MIRLVPLAYQASSPFVTYGHQRDRSVISDGACKRSAIIMRIQLLGSPMLLAGERRFDHPSRKAMALLAYLAMRADEHISRSHLATLLWGDSGEEQARANLRQTLSQLRKLFQKAGHDPIMVPFDKIILHSAGVEIDARMILEKLGDHEPGRLVEIPAFLEGFSVSAPEFETWMISQRNVIRSRLTTHLEKIADRAFDTGQHATAADCLSLALTYDPLHETLYRKLMENLEVLGRSDEALMQYEKCQRTLAKELQIEPDGRTRKLASEIRARRHGASLKTSAGKQSGEIFKRYPSAKPTIACVAPRLPDDGQSTWHHFDSAEAALTELLELRRKAINPNTTVAAVVSDTGNLENDCKSAATLITCAQPGDIVVSDQTFELFRHWSPFAFEPGNVDSDGTPSYRLVSEIRRHRLQVNPTVLSPQREPLSEFSVGVLPLDDRSPNAGEFALGDLLAEEITHRLSRYRNLTVAAPSAGQTLKRIGLSPERARSALGVNYLVDGNVFRQGDSLQIRLTLSDLRENRLVLSHHFDGTFESIYSSQSELINQIATAIFRSAEKSEVQRAERAPTKDIGAYEWYLRGLAAHRRAGISPDNARNAFSYFSEAIEIDPAFARALAWRLCAASWYAPEYLVDPGLKEIQYALSIDEYDAEVQRVAGALHLYRGNYEDGIRHIERAVELNSSDAYLLASSAVYWAYYGEPQNGLKHIERAIMLDPFLPAWCLEDHGVVLYSMGSFQLAIESLQKMSFPRARALAYLAASQVAAGQMGEAKTTIAKIRHIARHYSADELIATCYYRHESEKIVLRDRLSRAGLN